ncbi:MAG: sigma-70 family RNA polymerase sigma factor [Acidobacteria bacterium]|nr:sigma-70 family RNA polymerase sigma factor [Acidobacteriota bacterium]
MTAMLQKIAPTFSATDCTSAIEDGDCVRRCLQGDTAAFDEVVVRYQKPVFNAIFHMVNNYEDTRDLSQSAFLKAFINLESFDERRPLFSWLYRIAINEALNFLSGKRRVEPIVVDPPSTAAGPDEDFEAKEIARQLEDAMAQLSPDYRAAVVLRHSLGLSYDEAAEILAIPVKTFKSRLYSARQMLREHLMANGFGRQTSSNA